MWSTCYNNAEEKERDLRYTRNHRYSVFYCGCFCKEFREGKRMIGTVNPATGFASGFPGFLLEIRVTLLQAAEVTALNFSLATAIRQMPASYR